MPFKLITYIGNTPVATDFLPTWEKAEEVGEDNVELFADEYLIVEVDEQGGEIQ